jgi:hypothetical protein
MTYLAYYFEGSKNQKGTHLTLLTKTISGILEPE